MKFSIITLLTISSLLFIQPTQSTFPIPGLIDHVCRLTPHHHLCALTLKSHKFARKITTHADVAAFAKITLGVIAKKLPVILATLHKIHEQCENSEFKMALEGCIHSYTQISTEILTQALNCVDKGDLEGIKQHALNIAKLAASCHKKCMAFTGGSFSAFAKGGSGSLSGGSMNTGSSAGGSFNTGSSAGGSMNTGSSAGGSINTGSSAGGSMNAGSSAGGSINTGSGSASAGSTNTGSGSASAGGSTNTGSGSGSGSASAGGSINTGSGSASAGGSINTGSGSASAGSTNTGSGSASALKPAVMAAAKVIGESNEYVQNMCAITVSIVTKMSASLPKQTTLS